MEKGNDGHGLFGRALAVWCVLIAVEFIQGTLRTIFLVPVVGDFRSRQIGVFTGSILILVVAYFLVPWIHATEEKALILVGIPWQEPGMVVRIGEAVGALSWSPF